MKGNLKKGQRETLVALAGAQDPHRQIQICTQAGITDVWTKRADCSSTRLAYDICTLTRTYADVTFLVLSEVYDLFQLLLLSSAFICFPPD